MKPKLLIALLLGSAALNLFLLGVVATTWLNGPFPRGDGPEGLGHFGGLPLLRATVRAAGGPGDPRVRAVFRDHIANARQLRREIITARQRAQGELQAEPFVGTRMSQALTDLGRIECQAAERANHAAVELLTRMDAAERRQVRAHSPERGPSRAVHEPPPAGAPAKDPSSGSAADGKQLLPAPRD